MPFLPSNIVAGQAGHVAHSNQAYELLNQLQTSSAGSRMINVQKPPAAISAVGAVGDNSTDDNVALQNIFDWVKGTRVGTYWVWFPYNNASGGVARYRTSKPLRVWTGTKIVGPALICPTDSFDWVNHPYWQDAKYNPIGNPQPGDIALMELWNDTTGRGAISRIFLQDITLDCRFQPGSIGLFTKLQQPSWTWKVRIDNADIGWVMWGQQSEHFIVDILNVKIGLLLGTVTGSFDGSCKLMTFYALNIESFTEAGVRMDTEGPNWFHSVHMEGSNAPCFDARSGIFHVSNGLASVAGTMFLIGDKTPPPPPKNTFYSIRNWQITSADASYTKLMLDDRVTGLTIPVGYNRRFHDIARFYQNDTEADWDASIQYMGDEGGFIRMGGLKGGTSAPPGHSGAQFTVRPNTAQDEPSVRFLDSGGTLRTGIHQSGNFFLGEYTNATRATVAVGTRKLMIWNTDDNAPNYWDGTVWRDAMGTVT